MKERILSRQGLLVVSFVALMVALYMIFLWVPTEKLMGVVQRIFYFHVPLAWVAFLAFFIVFIFSIAYLRTRAEKWDAIARSSAEIGVVFTSLVLITGSIWAKSIWGVWWNWEPRLTSALVMWLIYVSYLLVRAYTTDRQRGARFAAVVGIVGFIDVPIVALVISKWRLQHPPHLIFQGGLAPPMLATLLVNLAAFTTLYLVLLLLRVSMTNASREIEGLKESWD